MGDRNVAFNFNEDEKRLTLLLQKVLSTLISEHQASVLPPPEICQPENSHPAACGSVGPFKSDRRSLQASEKQSSDECRHSPAMQQVPIGPAPPIGQHPALPSAVPSIGSHSSGIG